MNRDNQCRGFVLTRIRIKQLKLIRYDKRRCRNRVNGGEYCWLHKHQNSQAERETNLGAQQAAG